LIRAAETIITEHSGTPLHRCIAELEEDRNALQRAVDHSIEDYILLVIGNKSLLSERNDLKSHCEDLQAALAKARSDAKKRVADLDARVKTVKAHSEKRLRDLEDELVRKLEKLHGLYAGNVRTIRGLCSQMLWRSPRLNITSTSC
jgi:DNA repair exonuclease SbcCD ATPase subunit